MEQISDSTLYPAAPLFARLKPISPDYATLPILDGFNWHEIAAELPSGDWYMVVFRSVRRDPAEHLILEMHDYGAYIEAQRRATGLLHYYRGLCTQAGECLSFCIWTDREEALRAARLPLHTQAVRLVDEIYASYRLERYNLRKRPGARRLEAEPLGRDGLPNGSPIGVR